jgi:hypothetical protein
MILESLGCRCVLGPMRALRKEKPMSYECPRCRTMLVETDDQVNDFELEGAQVRHTIKRCAEVESTRAETHCMRDPSAIGCCAGPGRCSCECTTCICPVCEVNPCTCPPWVEYPK